MRQFLIDAALARNSLKGAMLEAVAASSSWRSILDAALSGCAAED
jgi:hypothetical protein